MSVPTQNFGGCGCAECPDGFAGCPSCICPGVTFDYVGTLTDANGTHELLYNSVFPFTGTWSCCYTISVTGIATYSGSCGSPTTIDLAIGYSVACNADDGTLEIRRFWAYANCSGTYRYNGAVSPLCGVVDSTTGARRPNTPSPGTVDVLLYAAEPDLCDPLELTGTPTGTTFTTDPVGGSVTISIPVATAECVPLLIECDPCSLPPDDLFLSYTNTDIGDDSGTMYYDPDTDTWTYSGTGGVATYGPNYASTCATSGSPAWTNPSNATANDGSFATVTVAGFTGTLTWTGFGFAVPTGSTIDGIEVDVWVKTTSPGTSGDNLARLVIGGSQAGSNMAVGTALSSGGAILTYGGPTDLWGLTPSVSDVNASNFGFAWQAGGSATISVDYARIKIYVSGIGWTAVLSCDGGSIVLTVTYGDHGGSQTLTTSSCDPFELVFTAGGDLATIDGFGTFTVTP